MIEPVIKVDGDVSPLRQKLREAGNSFKQFGAEGAASIERITAPLRGLTGLFGAFGAAISVAGFVAFAKKGIDAADSLNDLSQQLGISVENLAGYKLAAESSGITLDTLGTAVKKLSKFMAENPEKMQAIGITAKTADGALLQLADRFAAMPDGVEKTAVSMVLLGKAGSDMIPLLNGGGAALLQMTERGKELYPATKEMAAAADQFNDKVQELDVGIQGLSVQLGNRLLPILNALVKAWTDNAKEIGLMNAALVALGQLGTVGQTIGVLWANVAYVFKQVGNEIGGIAAQIAALASGDFKQAGIIGDMMKSDAKIARKEIDDLEKRIMGLGGKLPAAAKPSSTDSNPPASGGKSGFGALFDDGKSGKALKDRIKAEEDAFKAAVKAAEEYEAQWTREYNAVAEAARKSVKERIAIEMLQAEGAREATQAHIAEMEAQSAHEVALGITTQAEHLARLAQFNQQRLEADQIYQEQKRQLALQDPDQNPVELERIEQEKAAIRRRYAAEGTNIQQQQALESRNVWQSMASSMQSGFQNDIAGVLQGTLPMGQAIRGLMQSVANAVISTLAQIAAQYLITKLFELFFGQTVAKAQIAANAGIAATAAMGSVAAIPFYGWAMAPAVGATTYAIAMGYQGKLASAEGGYDIPKGLNPMAQLHEEEMVLPSKFANVIRGMAAGENAGGDSTSGGDIHIYARNDSDVVRVGDMKKLLREMNRNFVDVRPR